MRVANGAVGLTACAGLVVLAAACGGGASTRGTQSCALRPADSVFARAGPVYRDCAVDRQARLRTGDVTPNFRPASREACYTAEIEFVVDTAGLVEISTARVTRTNDQEFARSLLAVLPRYRYDPARVAGVPVRQIATAEETIAVRVVAAPAGAPPPPPPRGPQGC
jgi:hypothetical protein